MATVKRLTWTEWNNKLRTATEKEAFDLIATEERPMWKARAYSRFKRVREEREVKEMFAGKLKR